MRPGSGAGRPSSSRAAAHAHGCRSHLHLSRYPVRTPRWPRRPCRRGMNFLPNGIFLPGHGLLSELDKRAFSAADPRDRTEEGASASRPIWTILPVNSKLSPGRRGLVRRLARIVKRTPSPSPVRPSADPRAEYAGDGRRSKDIFRLTHTRVAGLRVEDRPDFVFQDRELVGFRSTRPLPVTEGLRRSDA